MKFNKFNLGIGILFLIILIINSTNVYSYLGIDDAVVLGIGCVAGVAVSWGGSCTVYNPIDNGDCSICNSNEFPFEPCTEYRCQAIGDNCEFFSGIEIQNEGTCQDKTGIKVDEDSPEIISCGVINVETMQIKDDVSQINNGNIASGNAFTGFVIVSPDSGSGATFTTRTPLTGVNSNVRRGCDLGELKLNGQYALILSTDEISECRYSSRPDRDDLFNYNLLEGTGGLDDERAYEKILENAQTYNLRLFSELPNGKDHFLPIYFDDPNQWRGLIERCNNGECVSYVKCMDFSGNVMDTDYFFTFSLTDGVGDVVPPHLINFEPTDIEGGYSSTVGLNTPSMELSFAVTDLTGIEECRFSNDDVGYDQMTRLTCLDSDPNELDDEDEEGTTINSHIKAKICSTTLSDIQQGINNYYFSCKDTSENQNIISPSAIYQVVGASPLTLSIENPEGQVVGSEDLLNVTTGGGINGQASCSYSYLTSDGNPVNGIPFGSDQDPLFEDRRIHRQLFSFLTQDQEYGISVTCRDLRDTSNVATGSITVNFQKPIRSDQVRCVDDSQCPICSGEDYCATSGDDKYLCELDRYSGRQSCINNICSANRCPSSSNPIYGASYCSVTPNPLCLSDQDGDNIADAEDCNDKNTDRGRSIGKCVLATGQRCYQGTSFINPTGSDDDGICRTIPEFTGVVDCTDNHFDSNLGECTLYGCKWNGDLKCNTNCAEGYTDVSGTGVCVASTSGGGTGTSGSLVVDVVVAVDSVTSPIINVNIQGGNRNTGQATCTITNYAFDNYVALNGGSGRVLERDDNLNPISYQYTHTFDDLSNGEYQYIVKCTDTQQGGTSEVRNAITITVDSGNSCSLDCSSGNTCNIACGSNVLCVADLDCSSSNSLVMDIVVDVDNVASPVIKVNTEGGKQNTGRAECQITEYELDNYLQLSNGRGAVLERDDNLNPIIYQYSHTFTGLSDGSHRYIVKCTDRPQTGTSEVKSAVTITVDSGNSCSLDCSSGNTCNIACGSNVLCVADLDCSGGETEPSTPGDITTCGVNNAHWADLDGNEIVNEFSQENVQIVIETQSCNGLDLIADIYEWDFFRNDNFAPDPEGNVANERLIIPWTTPTYQSEIPSVGDTDASPEYGFKIRIKNGRELLNVNSKLLDLIEKRIEFLSPSGEITDRTPEIRIKSLKNRQNAVLTVVDKPSSATLRLYYDMTSSGEGEFTLNLGGSTDLPLGEYKVRIYAYDGNPQENDVSEDKTFRIVETPSSCVENWVCTDWTPTICPASEQQTRTCTDSNNCRTITDKPDEIKTCTIVTLCDDSSDCSACATNSYCEEVLGSGKHLCTPSRIKQSCISGSCSADSCPTSGFSTDYCDTIPDPLCLSDIDNDRVADNLDCNDASTTIGQCDGTQCKQCNQVASASNNRGICVNISDCVVSVNCADTALDANQNTCTTAGCKWSGDTSKCDSNCQNNLVDNNEDGICEVPANTLDQCRIINPRWTNVVDGSIDLAYDDDPVKLKVDALNCQGLDVNFQIAENDGGLGVVRSDSNVNIPLIRNIEIINDVAEAEWEAQYINDVIGNPEYVFKAIVSDGTNTKESTWSSNLNVGVAEISFTTNSIKNEEMITQDNTTWKVEVRPSRERDNVVFVFENNNDLRISNGDIVITESTPIVNMNNGGGAYSINRGSLLSALIGSNIPLGVYNYQIFSYDGDYREGEKTSLRTFNIVEEVCEWVCTGFSPAECPTNGEITRTCINPNSCSTSSPSLIQTCEPGVVTQTCSSLTDQGQGNCIASDLNCKWFGTQCVADCPANTVDNNGDGVCEAVGTTTACNTLTTRDLCVNPSLNCKWNLVNLEDTTTHVCRDNCLTNLKDSDNNKVCQDESPIIVIEPDSERTLNRGDLYEFTVIATSPVGIGMNTFSETPRIGRFASVSKISDNSYRFVLNSASMTPRDYTIAFCFTDLSSNRACKELRLIVLQEGVTNRNPTISNIQLDKYVYNKGEVINVRIVANDEDAGDNANLVYTIRNENEDVSAQFLRVGNLQNEFSWRVPDDARNGDYVLVARVEDRQGAFAQKPFYFAVSAGSTTVTGAGGDGGAGITEPDPQECRITSIEWKDEQSGASLQSIRQGSEAIAVIRGESCEVGNAISYEILEKDAIAGIDLAQPDDVVVPSTGITFSIENVTIIRWTAVRLNDGFSPNNAYYVKAQNIESGLLNTLLISGLEEEPGEGPEGITAGNLVVQSKGPSGTLTDYAFDLEITLTGGQTGNGAATCYWSENYDNLMETDDVVAGAFNNQIMDTHQEVRVSGVPSIRYTKENLVRGNDDYTFYVRCGDEAGNSIALQEINFRINVPQSNRLRIVETKPSETQGSDSFTISAKTAGGANNGANVQCTYSGSLSGSLTRAFDNTNIYIHTATVSGISNGAKTITISCGDGAETLTNTINFAVSRDITPPQIVQIITTGGTKYIRTNEEAICKLSTTNNINLGNDLSRTENNRKHLVVTSSSYYAQCRDNWDNVMPNIVKINV